MGSGRLIVQAIHKYGKNNLLKEILEYCNSKEELNTVERHFIEEELLNDKAEYNIIYSEFAVRVAFKKMDIDDEQLLKWYFDENMSYKDISLKLKCSEPSVYNYMEKFREIDKRFDKIKHGDNRGKGGFTEESYKKAILTNSEKVECENCSRQISHNNYSKHLIICLDDNFRYINGYKKHKCAQQGCEAFILTKNKLCKEHYSENYPDLNNIKTPESMRKGGVSATHKRWHVARNKISETCELCQEKLKNNYLDLTF